MRSDIVDHVGLEREGACLTIVLNRPDKANALTEAMLLAIRDAVRDFDGKALILTGAGRVFCAGADLDAAHAGLATSPLWEEVSGAIAAFPGLSVAALNGTCAGGAVGMILACDLRVAAPGAKLFYPVMRLGFLPQPSDPARLSALVGPARAKLMLLAGAKIAAEDALAMGLVDRQSCDPVAEACALAADVLAADRAHATTIKGMMP